MASRGVRRRHHRRLEALRRFSEAGRSRAATRMLIGWCVEARRRAASLGAPAVWALADAPHVKAAARRVDPGGELYAELRRACAEAVADVAGRHLASGGRRATERRRRRADA
ncbi:MAG TPA: hypothetical protein VF170_11160 [Planctomycetaceae bacterium]